MKHREREKNYTLDFSPEVNQKHPTERVRVGSSWLSTTPVFSAYWRFAAERQEIFYNRLTDSPSGGPYTSDPILANFKFTNAYRASDRVSQYLIRHVIYRDDLPDTPEEVFFRVLLFKLFNRIDTWTHLERVIGPPVLREYNFHAYDKVLSTRMAQGHRIYSAAYIMPSAGSAFGHRFKHQNHLRLLEFFISKNFPRLLSDCKSMADAYLMLLSAPSIGPFLAYQYVTDLNYSTIVDFSEAEFVVAGPGALDGIEKCFLDAAAVSPSEIIKYMFEHQDLHFAEHGIKFRNLWGRPLQLIDCQNIFCEISKYARVAYPEYRGVAGRTRIKQKFTCAKEALPSPWYPPKWKINGRVKKEVELKNLL